MRNECRGHLTAREMRARFDPSYRQMLILRQPSDEALRSICDINGHLLNGLERSLDWILPDDEERLEAFKLVDRHHVRRVWENVTKNLAQKIAGKSRGDHLKRTDWQRFARECGLNPSQVVDRVEALAKSAIAEAEAAGSEVAAMPAGHDVILDQARQAIERRAHALLAQLHEFADESAITAIDEEAGPAEEEAEVRQLAAR